MKKIILFIAVMFLLLSNGTVQAQYILSMTLSPANPTTNDIITIYVEVAYPSANCDEHVQAHFINGNTISANTLHCVGPMTVICNDTDTFTIGTLNAGTYNFILQADAGFGSSPCTPGIVADPTDTLTFVVDVASGIENPKSNQLSTLYPNPATDYINISFTGSEALIEISSISGQLILSSVEKNNESLIQNYDVSKLASGIYIITIKTEKGISVNKFTKE